jgi:hypothetical protein
MADYCARKSSWLLTKEHLVTAVASALVLLMVGCANTTARHPGNPLEPHKSSQAAIDKYRASEELDRRTMSLNEALQNKAVFSLDQAGLGTLSAVRGNTCSIQQFLLGQFREVEINHKHLRQKINFSAEAYRITWASDFLDVYRMCGYGALAGTAGIGISPEGLSESSLVNDKLDQRASRLSSAALKDADEAHLTLLLEERLYPLWNRRIATAKSTTVSGCSFEFGRFKILIELEDDWLKRRNASLQLRSSATEFISCLRDLPNE